MQEGSLFSTPSPALPTMISITFSRAVSLQSTEDFSLGLLSHPSTPAPRHLMFQENLHHCPGCIGLQQGLSMWFLCHSDCHRWANALSNSLRCFSTVLDSYPDARISPLLQSPTLLVQVQSCSLSSSSPPSFILLSFVRPYIFLRGFPGSSASKESNCNAGDPGLIPGSRRSPGEGNGYPFQYSWASLVVQMVKNLSAVWGTRVGKIPWRRAWQPTLVFWPEESPWTEEPGGLQSIASQRVRHDWATNHSTAHVFLSGSQGLLVALSWCFAGSSVSDGVFLMLPRRELYSPSACFSAILSLSLPSF